ncbi:MAG: efflux RND transporter periplasmic adaptor subunit [Rikenellaceae bacterium]
MKKRTFFIALLALLALGSCKENQKAEVVTTHKTMIVTSSDQKLATQYTATLNGHHYVEIRPQVSGTITSILVNEGGEVRKGQTLFIIDQVPYKAALESAKANVESAKAKLLTAELTVDSKKALLKENVVSQFDLSTAENALAEAKATLMQAEAAELTASNNLLYTEVKSPVNGVASMIPYRVGALVSSTITDPLVSVSDDSKMYAYFSMTQNEILDLIDKYGSLNEAQNSIPDVNLLLSNGKEYSLSGEIDAISGTIDKSTGAVSVRAIFENPSQMLRNGANGTILIPTTKDDAVVIPIAATYELQDKVFVYRIVDGKAKSTEVKVFDINNGREYIVLSGLDGGEEIIAEGAGLVRDGSPINSQRISQNL